MEPEELPFLRSLAVLVRALHQNEDKERNISTSYFAILALFFFNFNFFKPTKWDNLSKTITNKKAPRALGST